MIHDAIEETLRRFGPLSLKDLAVAIGEDLHEVLEELSLMAENQQVESLLEEQDHGCSTGGCGSACGSKEPTTVYRWAQE